MQMQEINLIIQTLTLIALVFYVWKTWGMASASRKSAKISEKTLQEMKETRKQEFSPYVVAYFDVPYGKHLIELVIKNTGKTVAKNVKLKFTPPLANSHQGEKLNEQLTLIRDGVETIPPNYEIKTFIDTTIAYLNEKNNLPLKYKVEVSWTDSNNADPISMEWILDLSSYYGRLSISEKGIHELAETAEKLKTSFEKSGRDLERIKDILSDVLWLRSSSLVLNKKPTLETWKFNTLERLNSYRTLWETIYGKDNRQLVNPFLRNMRNIIISLAWELMKISSICPDSVPSETRNNLLQITKEMVNLGYKEFYMGGQSVKEFDDLGDEILALVNQAINEIVSL